MTIREIDQFSQSDFFKLQKKSNEVYSSKAWIEAYPNGIKCFGVFSDSNQLLGGFVAFEKIKWQLKMLITPPFASHVGWFFISDKSAAAKVHSERKSAIQALTKFLESSNYHYYKLEFADDFADAQPLIWSKIKVELRYTYVLDISRPAATLLENVDPKLRNKLNKSSEGLIVSHQKNDDAAYSLFSATLDKSGIKRDNVVLRHVMKGTSLQPTFMVQNGTEVALAMIAGQGNKCYYLFGAIDRNSTDNSIGPKAIWNSILYAQQLGFTSFDFEGSMVPEIEAYFRQFGGDIKHLYAIKGGRGQWPRLIQWYLS